MQLQKKSRNRELVYGISAVEQAIETSPEKILSAWVVKGREEDKRISKLIRDLSVYGIVPQIALRHFVDEKAEGGVHQGIIIEMKSTPPKTEQDLFDYLDKLREQKVQPFFIILDGVTDPRNLGAVMRSAWAAGCHGVIVPKDKSATLNPAARKAAAGAASAVPFFAITNLARVMSELDAHRIRCIGMDGNAEKSIYRTNFNGAIAIVMGSEDTGMRRLTREKCVSLTKIPMAEGVDSLNVSVAAGIAIFEAVRQRAKSQKLEI